MQAAELVKGFAGRALLHLRGVNPHVAGLLAARASAQVRLRSHKTDFKYGLASHLTTHPTLLRFSCFDSRTHLWSKFLQDPTAVHLLYRAFL